VPSARLERSVTNRVVGGVCGGIAEYLAVDPTLVRVVFVLGTLATAGLGILGYIVLLILMPLPGRPAPFVSANSPASAGTATTSDAPAGADPATHAVEGDRRRAAAGYLLIALGLIFFLGNAGAFRIVQWQFIWPLALIAIGALLLAQRIRT